MAFGQLTSAVTSCLGQSWRRVSSIPDLKMPTMTTVSKLRRSRLLRASQTVRTTVGAEPSDAGEGVSCGTYCPAGMVLTASRCPGIHAETICHSGLTGRIRIFAGDWAHTRAGKRNSSLLTRPSISLAAQGSRRIRRVVKLRLHLRRTEPGAHGDHLANKGSE